jgi:Fe-S cluster biosynthesis and repair protein YggX
MSRTVFCRKYQEQLPGLNTPPYPGAKGQDIFENVSQKAWQEWQKQQTMLINEKQLSMMNPEHRKYLQAEMDKFLSNQDHDTAEGFVPQE